LFTLKRKLEFLHTTFAVILSVVALPVVLKVEFSFKVILYITIFVFLSPRSCFKSAICIQNSLESAPTCKHEEASLVSVSEISGLKTTALTPFLLRLDIRSFIKEINNVATTSLSPCLKKSTKNGAMWNVKLFPDPVGDLDE